MYEPFTPLFFRQLQQLRIHTRRVFLGSRQGGHLSLRRGHGLEFSDYRHYAPGDDFRNIDWSVYARTDRLYVKEFREEQDLNVLFLIDMSESMNHPAEKFALVRNIALALGYVALSDGDAVTFAYLGQRLSPRYVGPRALARAYHEMSQRTPQGRFRLLSEVRAAISRQKIPGKCFFLSDFLYELDEQYSTLDLLRSKNFDISLLQVLSPGELNLDTQSRSSLFVDSETGETLDMPLDRASRIDYAKALADHVEALESYCRSAGLVHTLISSEESVNEVVLTRLPELGLLR